MEKLNLENVSGIVEYNSPMVSSLEIKIKRMLCNSLYAGTEGMRMDGSVDPSGNGQMEDMDVESIEF